MQNPFEIIAARLSNIEALLIDIKHNPEQNTIRSDESEYGSFKWFVSETGLPESSARQLIARGDVPGVSKIGKLLILHKATVHTWIANNQRQSPKKLDVEAEKQFILRNTEVNRKRIGGRKAA